ncbi:hypothetical protein G6O69_02550 [Pseudenhygromyxa sp. WMMC2535]|uniref:Spy/CpxP family protein refolding chaperone n=1 Tax=Pseudenhygromyxa sp. WMMC2535 TaxID=2712867 RepID=UPI0015520BD8|nr:Spy/CpxP family protein refolding chaperone [Pseudenhygromyxa sp. WMMC2535]NVB36695.1 hypothetical protein [Pseudenhygromyxa sp. WMMC2535]
MTITKFTTGISLACAMLFTAAACDSEEVDDLTEERSAAASELDVETELDAAPTDAEGKRPRPEPGDFLCKDLECSDEQAAQISALFAERHEARKLAHESKSESREAFKAARAEKDATLAAAFRAESFDASVLEDIRPKMDRSAHVDEAVEFASELHAILTPAQRATLADRIQEGGPMFFAGGPRGGKHGMKGPKGPRGKKSSDSEDSESSERPAPPAGDRVPPSSEERLARHVESFCEPIECTDAQSTALAAAFQGAHEARRDMPKPDFSSVATAFRADSLDSSELRAAMLAAKPEVESSGSSFGEVIAEVHDILTAEQREVLAERIESDGLHGLMGKGGRRGHHGPRGKSDRAPE